MHSIIGIDEAGRGPWAGPVAAGAVFFDAKNKPKIKIINELNDSKQLSKTKRERLYGELLSLEKKGLCIIGTGLVNNVIIDEIGIRKANKMAMQLALDEVKSKIGKYKANKILVDGRDNYVFDNNSIETEYLIKGDTKIDEIKAASIIAKVTRDHIMEEYSKTYTGYHFELHSGYGTKKHQEAINILGVCPIHRCSYAPIKKALILEQKAIQGANNQ